MKRRICAKRKDVSNALLEPLSAPKDIDSLAVIEQSPVVPPSCSKWCKPISFGNNEPATVCLSVISAIFGYCFEQFTLI